MICNPKTRAIQNIEKSNAFSNLITQKFKPLRRFMECERDEIQVFSFVTRQAQITENAVQMIVVAISLKMCSFH